MTQPQAVERAEGYRYQILTRHAQHAPQWEHCDYAADRADLRHLLTNYQLAYGNGWQFKTFQQPRKFWPKPQPAQASAQ